MNNHCQYIRIIHLLHHMGDDGIFLPYWNTTYFGTLQFTNVKEW